MECTHNWQLRASGIKESCTICGVVRVYDPNRCAHEWEHISALNKDRCKKCGDSRMTLDIADLTHKQSVPNISAK